MAGVVVNEMIMEKATATLKVIANSRNMRPRIPPISKMGMNTAMSDVLMERTVNPISRAPRKAASWADNPCSRYREMF